MASLRLSQGLGYELREWKTRDGVENVNRVLRPDFRLAYKWPSYIANGMSMDLAFPVQCSGLSLE